jgi:tetratricopeptide (TPR) repeat protein
MEQKRADNRALYAVQQTIRLVASLCYLGYGSLRSSAHPFQDLFDMAATLVRSLFPWSKRAHTNHASESRSQELVPETKVAKELIALYERAKFHADNGERELALADYDECVRQNPGQYLSYRAHFLGTTGSLERAVEDYQMLIDLKSDELQTKIEGSKEYLQAQSNLASIYWRRAYVYELNDRFDSALSDYRQSASISHHLFGFREWPADDYTRAI